MALIAQSDLEARLGRTLTADEASAFAIVNASNQAYIERMIGSSVEAASETTRYYDGGVQHLAIDPVSEISAVNYVDDDSAAYYLNDTTDYTTEPRNRQVYQMLRFRPGAYPRGINNIAVTGKFSTYADAGLTAIIKDALIAMAEASFSATERSTDVAKESIEGYTVEYISNKQSVSTALDKVKAAFPGII